MRRRMAATGRYRSRRGEHLNRPDAVRERVYGGDYDHVTFPSNDLRQRSAHAAPHAEQVDFDDSLEFVTVHRVCSGRLRCNPGVRDHDVQPAEALHDGLDRSLDGVTVTDVGGQAHRLPGADARRRVPGGLLLEIDDRHRCPTSVRRPRRREPDPLGATRDQRCLAAELVSRHPPSLAQKRNRCKHPATRYDRLPL